VVENDLSNIGGKYGKTILNTIFNIIEPPFLWGILLSNNPNFGS